MVVVIDKKPSKAELEKIFSKTNRTGKGVDVSKYAGKIKARKSPLALQRKLRNEWD
jgi:hypothetical protein